MVWTVQHGQPALSPIPLSPIWLWYNHYVLRKLQSAWRFRPFMMRRASALAVEGIFFMTLQIFWAAIAQNRGRVLGNVKTQWLIPEAYPVIGVIAAGV